MGGTLSVAADTFLQRPWLRHVPGLDACCGPVAGLTCIVTGPTSGIGRETAAALVRGGAHVILACRSRARGEKLRAELLKEALAGAKARGPGAAPGSAEVRVVDLASLASVRVFAAHFCAGGAAGAPAAAAPPPLHVLVNNAGVFAMVGPRSETADGLETHMGTNHLGPFLLTLLLLPALAAGGTPSSPSRIVHVSSAMHRTASGAALASDPQQRLSYSSTAAYSQSKLAQVVFAAELRRRLAAGVKAERGGGGGGVHQRRPSSPDSAPASPTTPSGARRRRRRGGAGRRRGGGAGGGGGGGGAHARPSLPITVVAVHPGEVMTDVVRSLPAAVRAAYRWLMAAVLLTPAEGARSSVWAASATGGGAGGGGGGGRRQAGPSVRGLVGPSTSDPALCYFGSTCEPEAPLPDALDPALGRWLWAWSAVRVGLRPGEDVKVAGA